MMTPERPEAWRDLAEAIAVLSRYPTSDVSPFNCQHDMLQVLSDASKFSPMELARLDDLGFHPDEFGGFYSFRYGSA